MSYSSNTSFGVTEESMVAVPATRLIWVLPSWIPIMPILLFRTGTATRTVSGGEKRRYANLSYFGRASYDYAGKYFANSPFVRMQPTCLSFLFAETLGLFPRLCLSAGYFPTRNLWKNLKSISHLKLRASWGQNGSIAGLADYMYDATILSGINYPMSGDVSYETGSLPSATGNYDLKWETSEQIDLGIDLRMLNDRLSFDLTIMRRKTKDLIVTGITPSF